MPQDSYLLKMLDLDLHFPRYTAFDPLVPVWCVTPRTPRCLHRFFDTSPLSPSGRYLAVFQLPFEDRPPQPKETGRVCLVDLQTGEEKTVAETMGWEPQLGANINWGGSDHELFFNDVDPTTWKPFAWKLDPLTGARQQLEGPVYHASPDGRWLVSANLTTLRKTQPGYGVAIPRDHLPFRPGPLEDDGFYLTDTRSSITRLLISIADLLARANPKLDMESPERQEIQGFHCKFNPQGDRLMLSLRWFPAKDQAQWDLFAKNYPAVRFAWFTMKVDGSELHCAVGPEQWLKGGHHATWFPDGQRLSMNLNLHEDGMRFAQVRADGSDLSLIHEHALGTGHPTVHPSEKYLITDAYNFESVAFSDGTVPLRWLNLETGLERAIVRIPTQQPCEDIVMRVDPHPAWDRTWRYLTFNAFVEGTRRVFIADMQCLLD